MGLCHLGDLIGDIEWGGGRWKRRGGVIEVERKRGKGSGSVELNW